LYDEDGNPVFEEDEFGNLTIPVFKPHDIPFGDTNIVPTTVQMRIETGQRAVLDPDDDEDFIANCIFDTLKNISEHISFSPDVIILRNLICNSTLIGRLQNTLSSIEAFDRSIMCIYTEDVNGDGIMNDIEMSVVAMLKSSPNVISCAQEVQNTNAIPPQSFLSVPLLAHNHSVDLPNIMHAERVSDQRDPVFNNIKVYEGDMFYHWENLTGGDRKFAEFYSSPTLRQISSPILNLIVWRVANHFKNNAERFYGLLTEPEIIDEFNRTFGLLFNLPASPYISMSIVSLVLTPDNKCTINCDINIQAMTANIVTLNLDILVQIQP
jgi:hypothetical protein